MIYYKILPKFDQTRRKDGSILVANEIYTKKEVLKYNINPIHFFEVQISKFKTYFFFGARFEEMQNYN